MQLFFDMGPEFKKVVSDVRGQGQRIRQGASRGLAASVQIAADHVGENYLSGQYLKVRTKNLKNAVQGWMAGDLDGVVGVAEDAAVNDYAYLLGDEVVTIRPKTARFLAIPIGEALTPSGVLKGEYAGGLRNIKGGFFFESKGQLLFGIRKGKTERARVRPLFVLKRQVTVYGTGALYDGVDESLDAMARQMTQEINEELN